MKITPAPVPKLPRRIYWLTWDKELMGEYFESLAEARVRRKFWGKHCGIAVYELRRSQ